MLEQRQGGQELEWSRSGEWGQGGLQGNLGGRSQWGLSLGVKWRSCWKMVLNWSDGLRLNCGVWGLRGELSQEQGRRCRAPGRGVGGTRVRIVGFWVEVQVEPAGVADALSVGVKGQFQGFWPELPDAWNRRPPESWGSGGRGRSGGTQQSVWTWVFAMPFSAVPWRRAGPALICDPGLGAELGLQSALGGTGVQGCVNHTGEGGPGGPVPFT